MPWDSAFLTKPGEADTGSLSAEHIVSGKQLEDIYKWRTKEGWLTGQLGAGAGGGQGEGGGEWEGEREEGWKMCLLDIKVNPLVIRMQVYLSIPGNSDSQ